MKKIVSLLLAVLMVLSMLPVMAFADELQQIDLNAEEQQSEEENKAEEPESKMKNAVLLTPRGEEKWRNAVFVQKIILILQK